MTTTEYDAERTALLIVDPITIHERRRQALRAPK